MRCERAQELFSDYHEGSVQTALLVPLENHLSTCPACRAELEGLKDLWGMLDRAPVVEPPAEFRAIVWRKIEADQQKEVVKARPSMAFNWRSLFARPNLGWAMAVLVVIVLAGVAVPGRYSQAGQWFPWSLFRASDSAGSGLVISNPEVSHTGAVSTLVIPLNNTTDKALSVEFDVLNGPVEDDGKATEFTIPAGSHTDVTLGRLTQSTWTSPIRVQASWEQDGVKQAKTLEVSTP